MAYVRSEVQEARILRAALRVLSRDGLAKTSMRAVAGEAGISLSSLQHVFSTKESLLKAVVRHSFLTVDPPTGEAASFGDRLVASFNAWWTTILDQGPGNHLSQFEVTIYALRDDLSDGLAAWQYDQYLGSLELWLDKIGHPGDEAPGLPRAQLARLLMAVVDGLLLQWLIDPDLERAIEDMDRTISALALLADPAT
ncbi:TetR/AcrR family transcriptional regulator [Actinocorallia sp. A-T 12471]|uniref:TetR/AcrR family transcriptional regulator n=1 Tax=Actinocorallia sp. A-T 12471 TaxID=3089813 RepID=UPI0029D24046|nr:TetR/AcrR family transcriptional regulator [Actinocorallia sp. A-T 12471]MDX6739541.1 TetR/AcrR family transcriptional regulator [Actinocorallia sp. A-T 12471]